MNRRLNSKSQIRLATYNPSISYQTSHAAHRLLPTLRASFALSCLDLKLDRTRPRSQPSSEPLKEHEKNEGTYNNNSLNTEREIKALSETPFHLEIPHRESRYNPAEIYKCGNFT